MFQVLSSVWIKYVRMTTMQKWKINFKRNNDNTQPNKTTDDNLLFHPHEKPRYRKWTWVLDTMLRNKTIWCVRCCGASTATTKITASEAESAAAKEGDRKGEKEDDEKAVAIRNAGLALLSFNWKLRHTAVATKNKVYVSLKSCFGEWSSSALARKQSPNRPKIRSLSQPTTHTYTFCNTVICKHEWILLFAGFD